MSHQARLQEMYAQIRALKQEKKEINDMIKDELAQHDRYAEIQDEMKMLRAERRRIKIEVRETNPVDAARLEDIKVELKNTKEVLSDIAFNMLMNQETVEVVDERENRYVPQFKVRFKKAN